MLENAMAVRARWGLDGSEATRAALPEGLDARLEKSVVDACYLSSRRAMVEGLTYAEVTAAKKHLLELGYNCYSIRYAAAGVHALHFGW